MKAKKWLAKPLALGLAIATAVTSMGVPGGLLAPQTVYAAEEDGSGSSNDENIVLFTTSKPAITGNVTLEGDAIVGSTLTAKVENGIDDEKLKYQFFRVKGGQSTSLGAASTAKTYTLTQDDIGSTIKVEVTADNYDGKIVSAQTSEVPKLKHSPLSLIVTVATNAEGTKTVTIESVDGAEYSFDGDADGAYKSGTDSNKKSFTSSEIGAKKEITVAIRYKEDDKYESAAVTLTQTIDLTKDMPAAPNVGGFEFAANKDKTAYDIKVTVSNISEGETLEYSTDGNTYTASDQIITGLAANTTYTLYVRKAATDTANASSVRVSTITTPDAFVAPTIAGEERFKDKTSVAITGSGEIYYTTDGKSPTISSTRYNGPIEVSTTTTSKAIAVENGKIMSAVTGKTFTKETTGGGNQGGTSSSGSSGGGSASIPSKDDTKTDDTKKDDTKKDDTKKDETTKTDPSKTEISAEKIAEAVETKDAEVTVKTVDANGKTVREVTAKASDLVAGKKVKVIKIDPKTGEKTLVNETSYRVAADGSLVLDDLGKGNYKVVSLAEANALTKEILQTIKPQKTKMNLTVGKKTKFKFDDALNMDNVAKITYKTDNKSIATINKDGTITAKKAGKVTIKAVVTLKNGKKKTVKMTITVKKKK